MSAENNRAIRAFEAIVQSLSRRRGVTAGARGTKGFGASALKVNGKIFAMVSSRGEFVLKLPAERVASLEASGAGRRFDPGHGRLMREWVALTPKSSSSWLGLAEEALHFVRSTS